MKTISASYFIKNVSGFKSRNNGIAIEEIVIIREVKSQWVLQLRLWERKP